MELAVRAGGKREYVYIDITAYKLVDGERVYIEGADELRKVAGELTSRKLTLVTNIEKTDGTTFDKLTFE